MSLLVQLDRQSLYAFVGVVIIFFGYVWNCRIGDFIDISLYSEYKDLYKQLESILGKRILIGDYVQSGNVIDSVSEPFIYCDLVSCVAL